MNLDDFNWRPITFEGETFPPSLMGISVLESILKIEDEQVANWVWRFPICKGFPKKAPAETCSRCSALIVELLRANKHAVVEGIRERLGAHGFDPDTTYRQWGVSLLRISELSSSAAGDCHWSAPSHERDRVISKEAFLDALERFRDKADSGE